MGRWREPVAQTPLSRRRRGTAPKRASRAAASRPAKALAKWNALGQTGASKSRAVRI